MKKFEIERDLLLPRICDTFDRVKTYLADFLLGMKNKKRFYCIRFSKAEVHFRKSNQFDLSGYFFFVFR